VEIANVVGFEENIMVGAIEIARITLESGDYALLIAPTDLRLRFTALLWEGADAPTGNIDHPLQSAQRSRLPNGVFRTCARQFND